MKTFQAGLCAALLVLLALGGCSSDPAPADAEASATADGQTGPTLDGGGTSQPDGDTSAPTQGDTPEEEDAKTPANTDDGGPTGPAYSVEIEIIEPVAGSMITEPTEVSFEVTGDVDKLIASELYADGFRVATGEAEARRLALDPAQLEDGSHLLLVAAIVLDAESARDEVQVFTDAWPPTLEILEPWQNTPVTDSVHVKLKVSDPGGVREVKLEIEDLGISETLYDPPWQLTLRWDHFLRVHRELLVTATDTYGHSTTRTIILSPDEAASRVEIVEPADGATLSSASFTVAVALNPSLLPEEERELVLLVDGVASPPVGGPWTSGDRYRAVITTPPDALPHKLRADLVGPSGTIASHEIGFQADQGTRVEVQRCLDGVRCYTLEPGAAVEGGVELVFHAEVTSHGVSYPWIGSESVSVDGEEVGKLNLGEFAYLWETEDLETGSHRLGLTLRREQYEVPWHIDLEVGTCTADSCAACCEGSCGDGVCDPHRNETPSRCSADCPCGDGTCAPGTETPATCHEDCGVGSCGDGHCVPFAGENDPDAATFCLADCPPVCGDGFCYAAQGETDPDSAAFCKEDCCEHFCGDCECEISVCEETAESCPQDCDWTCGDLVPQSCDLVMSERWVASEGSEGMDCRIDLCTCPLGGAGCGDGCCRGYICGEDPESCPEDCHPPCGNGVCEHGETPAGCADDCKTFSCGNHNCDWPHENERSCPEDCARPLSCGDCRCSAELGESFSTCPLDCGFCGDEVCAPCSGENRGSCPEDCRCGDGACDHEERAGGDNACREDCHCGDGACEAADGEDPTTCARDCGCGDGTCDAALGETPHTCAVDCPCGDGVCSDAIGEGPSTCPEDCHCGDGTCAPLEGENTLTCLADCHCGDGECSAGRGEDAATCPRDCLCGDGICEPDKGESAALCPDECLCGNGICNKDAGETATSCPGDCRCGDFWCESPVEDATSCPEDCCRCGNCSCESACGEDESSCPTDCAYACGDFESADCEHLLSTLFVLGHPAGKDCRMDVCQCRAKDGAVIGSGCGDGCCMGFPCGEDPVTCPEDCRAPCGDEVCDPSESVSTCPGDCRDAAVCGNGTCDRPDESPWTCMADCRGSCGNCVCEPDEGFGRCPVDCGTCGDGVCSPCLGEREASCEVDCKD